MGIQEMSSYSLTDKQEQWYNNLSSVTKKWADKLTYEQKNWFYNLANLTDIVDLVKQLELTPQTESQLWHKILALLQSETSPLQEQEIDENSLFGFIINNEDLKDINDKHKMSVLYSKIKELINGSFQDNYWNQSLVKLIKFVNDNLFSNDDNDVILPIGTNLAQHAERDITISVLKQGDAGNNFPQALKNTNKWVIPWWNINNKNYDEVRKCDEVLAILQNEKKMQYTRAPYADSKTLDEISKWIRLLMPQYGRRVEVEDLNRNFWVIAQVISAISHYLFDEDTSLPKALEGLLREVTELWENILYLWLGIAAISQEKSGIIRTIVMPLPPRTNDHRRKYDKIGEADSICGYRLTNSGYLDIVYKSNRADFDKTIIERLTYLTEKYEENLIIIPIIRLNNYKHNYYSIEYYPGCYIYHQGTKKWKVIEFKEKYSNDDITKYYPLFISPRYELKDTVAGELIPRYSNRIYGVNQMQGQLAYIYPFTNIEKVQIDEERVYLYGALRTEVASVPLFNINDDFLKFDSDNFFIFNIFDASGDREEVNNKKASLLGTYKGSVETLEEKEIISFSFIRNNEDTDNIKDTDAVHYKTYKEDNPICYLGEVASWRKHSINITKTENLFKQQSYLIKIGNFLPKQLADDNQSKYYYMSRVTLSKGVDQTENFTSMAGNVTSKKMLNPDAENLSEVCYFSFNWDTYRTETVFNNKKVVVDGDSTQECNADIGAICFSETPKKQPLNYFKESQLRYDGLKAAVNYLKAHKEKTKNPCYITTTVGLTPWKNQDDIFYWDVAEICHIYMFIPTIQRVIGKEDIDENLYDVTEYVNAYNNMPTLKITVNNNTVIGEVKDGEQILGKIVACQKMDRYDGFFTYFDMVTENPYDTVPGGWRQFFINGDANLNSCTMKEIDGGAEKGGKTIYTAHFNENDSFQGTIDYYDARWNQSKNEGKSLPNDKAHIATAKIKITENGYQQYGKGKIVEAGNSSFEKREDHLEVSEWHTGLQRKLVKESGVWKEEDRSPMGQIYSGDLATKFYGLTPLPLDSNTYAKYVNP